VAAQEEVALFVDELVGDGEDGFLAQREEADEAAAIADLVAQELACFGIDLLVADHVLVEIIDAELRKYFPR
jgi:hypothetical protein